MQEPIPQSSDIKKDEIEKNISLFEGEKNRLTKVFVAVSDNLKKYDEKLKTAKQEFSKKYHKKKVDRYRDNSIRILKMLTFIDNSIIRLKEELTIQFASDQESVKKEA